MFEKNTKLREAKVILTELAEQNNCEIYSDALDLLNLAIFEYEKNLVKILVNKYKESESNFTKIAEQICDEYDVNFGGGPLDDPDHWIWEIVSEC